MSPCMLLLSQHECSACSAPCCNYLACAHPCAALHTGTMCEESDLVVENALLQARCRVAAACSHTTTLGTAPRRWFRKQAAVMTTHASPYTSHMWLQLPEEVADKVRIFNTGLVTQQAAAEAAEARTGRRTVQAGWQGMPGGAQLKRVPGSEHTWHGSVPCLKWCCMVCCSHA